MSMMIGSAALLLNMVMCASWAAQVDTFIISNAVLLAALVLAVSNDENEKRQR